MKSSEYLKRTPWTIIVIFSIVAAGILVTGYFYYDTQKDRIKREQYSNLNAIADLKTNQIIQWRNERLNDGEIIRTNPLLADEIKAFFKNPTDQRTRHNLFTWMTLMQTIYGYGSIFFCDQQGIVRLSSITAGDTVGPLSRHAIAEALRLKNVVLHDLYRKDSSSPVYMSLTVPLIMKEQGMDVLIGVCVLRIDPEKLLFPLVQTWPTPSRSSETLLIRREGNNVLFLNELRHQKNTALTLQFPITEEKLIAAIALRGIEGTIEGVDYRGVPVLASIRKIPNSPWFMVAKVDQEELYASLHSEAWREGVVIFILIFAAAASLGFWWRHQRAIFYRNQYKAEIERQALVTHFDYLTKYANDIIFLTDEHLRIVEVNDKILQVYGYTRDETTTLGVADLRSAESVPDLLAHKKLIDEHQGAVYETIHRRKDGTTFPIELSVRPFEIDGKKFYQAIGRDITERKHMEEILRQDEERFRRIFDEGQLGMATVSPNYRFIRINPAFYTMMGYTESELLSMTFKDITHPDHLSQDLESVQQLYTGKIPFYHTIKRYIKKNGTIVWGSVTISAIRDKDSQFLYFLAMIEDISKRKEVEETLRVSEEKFSKVFQNSPVLISIATIEDGTYIEVNDEALRVSGFSREEMIGKQSSDIGWITAENRNLLLQESRKNGRVMGMELEFKKKNGETLHGLVSGEIVSIQGRDCFLTVTVDITERKHAAEQLEILKKSIDLHYDGAYWMDTDNKFIYVNDTGCRALGYTQNELLTMKVSDVNPKATDEILQEVWRKLRTDRFFTSKSIHRRKDGIEFPVEIVSTYVMFGGKEYNCGFARDITEQKKAEETLRRSEADLKRAQSVAHVGNWTWDIRKDSITWSDEMYKIYGLSKETLPGTLEEVIASVIHPDDRQKVEKSNLSVIEQKKPIPLEYRVIWPDTSVHFVWAEAGELILDESGSPSILTGIAQDITERKKNEIRILKLNRTYAVLSNINQLIVRERAPQKLLDGVCKIAVDDGGFAMAWIGLLKEDSNIITPMASAGMTDNYLDHLNLTLSDTPEGRGQLGEDLRNGHSVIINDIEHNKRSMPWRERALSRGYKSSAVFPLRKGNTTIGAFSFYSNEHQFFSIDEVRLLEELSMDVAYALDSLELEEQRKHAEEALQISEKNFRSFIESAPDAVFVQTQLQFAYLNPAALRLFGAESAEQMLGQPVIDRMHPDVRELVRERIQKLNYNEVSVPKLRQKYLRLDGSTVDVEVSAVPVFYEGSHGALVFVSDISERKKIEFYTENLGELKEQLISTKNFDRRIKIVTDGLVDIFGADFARIWIIDEADLCEKGCPHAQVSTGPDVCHNRTNCLHLISSSGRYTHIDGGHRRVPFGAYKIGRVASGEDAKFITNDVVNDSRVHDRAWAKSLGLVSFAGYRLISAEGMPIGVMALFRNRAIEYYEEKYLEDIANTTSQIIHARTAEEALEESETRAHFLADVVQNASQPFVVGYPDGRLVQFNAAFLKLTGYNEEEIVSINWTHDLTPPEWRDFEIAKLDELHKTDKPVRYEKEYIRKDGNRVPIELLVHLHKDDQGRPEYYYAFITDITEPKRLQYQLLQSQKLQSIGTLAGGIAHDFNNILGIIMGYASLLERGGVTAGKFSSHVNAIKSSVERGASLVRQILTFARRTDIAFEPIHVPDLVNDILSMIKETFPKMITIQNVVEEDIPTINADRTQLHQALLNLCVNARDAMPNGGELMITVEKVKRHTLTKRFPSADQDYYVCLRVSDTGIGMSEEIRSRIFDPFFTTKEKGKGTGLGLSVVLGIVQSHRGFTDVESTPGAGTTFTLYIPLPSYQGKNPGKRASEDGAEKGGSETILIVEDEILLLEITQSMLESNGYNILTAGDGEQAIEIYTRHKDKIALVITDMGMPKLSGVEEIKILREINPRVKVILATGFLEPRTRTELLEAGAKGIIQKPYVAKEMLRMIREVLETSDE